MLDLVPPSAAGLRSAAAHIERARSEGPVLVCCALGYSRSAAAAATWLLTSRTAGTVAEAIDQVRGARPGIVVDTALRDRIATAAERAG
jgi:protein-tyrosine phosphatase